MSRIDRRALLALGAAGFAGTASARPQSFGSVKAIPGGAWLTAGNQVVEILFTASGTVSVVKRATEARVDTAGFFLTHEQLAQDVTVKGDKVRHGDIEVRIDRAAGRLVFLHRGRLVMSDDGAPAGATFTLSRACDLYGLGQFRDAMANYRDRTVYLAQANMDSVLPLLVGSDGWGLLWDTETDSHLTSSGARLTYTNTSPLTRYHLCLGGDIGGVIAAYRRLTGRAPLLGKYAFGFWQSQERYKSQDEIAGMVEAYRARHLPLDIVVQDWRYWGEDDGFFSGMVWDPVNFPDPKAMCDRIHRHNAHVIASVWPAFGPKSEIYKTLDGEGLLFKGPHWGGGKVLDITSPRARDIYWSYINNGLMSVGLDGLWTDGCEPEFMSTGSRYVTARSYAENGNCAAGPIKDHLLTFSYYQTRLIYQSMRRDHPDKRPLTLSRKAYAGQQAFNAVTWSGDIFAGWQTLNYQITAAQQVALAGLAYWTDDIGGFLVSHRFPDKLDDPAYRELYVRWFQFGAFMSIFRAHGTEIPREVFAFGEAGDRHYEALKVALEQRYALMPYIYAQADHVTHRDEPFLRPLVMDYSHDAQIGAFGNQYLFGRDILVCVVNTPLEAEPADLYDFIPNYAVIGRNGPAADVSFYEGVNFDTLVESRQSDDLKMSWSGDLPYALKGKPYSHRWVGKIVAQESGRHGFRVTAQGLVHFVLDGQVRVASVGKGSQASDANGGVSFKGHNGDDVYSFEIDLDAGKAYDFELSQSQPTPDAVSLWIEWSRPSYAAGLRVTPDKGFKVYLPAGHDWYSFDGTQRFQGGQLLSLRPALNQMPVYVRAGAIIPQTPGLQYAMHKPDRIELHVYAGADGSFALYDDAGDGHGYERGEFRRWPLRWDDKARTLVFDVAEGSYAPDEEVAFTIVRHDGMGRGETTVTAVPSQTLSVSF